MNDYTDYNTYRIVPEYHAEVWGGLSMAMVDQLSVDAHSSQRGQLYDFDLVMTAPNF